MRPSAKRAHRLAKATSFLKKRWIEQGMKVGDRVTFLSYGQVVEAPIKAVFDGRIFCEGYPHAVEPIGLASCDDPSDAARSEGNAASQAPTRA